MPSDGGLRRIADGMTADPSDRATVHAWAKRIGDSETAPSAGSCFQETGMVSGRWQRTPVSHHPSPAMALPGSIRSIGRYRPGL